MVGLSAPHQLNPRRTVILKLLGRINHYTGSAPTTVLNSEIQSVEPGGTTQLNIVAQQNTMKLWAMRQVRAICWHRVYHQPRHPDRRGRHGCPIVVCRFVAGPSRPQTRAAQQARPKRTPARWLAAAAHRGVCQQGRVVQLQDDSAPRIGALGQMASAHPLLYSHVVLTRFVR